MRLRKQTRVLAETLNKLLPESPSKADVLGRLFRIGVDAELALRMDGGFKNQKHDRLDAVRRNMKRSKYLMRMLDALLVLVMQG